MVKDTYCTRVYDSLHTHCTNTVFGNTLCMAVAVHAPTVPQLWVSHSSL